jgi:hypothetical protein
MARIALGSFGLPGWRAAAAVVVGGVLACTSAPDLPRTLGGCDATADVDCRPAVPVGGGVNAPDSSASSSDASPIGDATTSCGIGGALTLASEQCVLCIATSCCNVAMLCAADTTCPALVTDCQGCTNGSQCAQTCSSAQLVSAPVSLGTFSNFANCLKTFCLGACPALQVGLLIDP